jgi:uroporphyrinogen-III synthase
VSALVRAGVAASQIDAPPDTAAHPVSFDSEALWVRVAAQVQARDRVLIVRGGDPGAAASSAGLGRDWLAKQVAARGAQAEFVVAYERSAPTLSAAQLALARQAASDGSIWLWSSSQAIAHLRGALPLQSWANARALATHPRIAQAAKDAGFAQVRLSAPTLGAVIASIKSLA